MADKAVNKADETVAASHAKVSIPSLSAKDELALYRTVAEASLKLALLFVQALFAARGNRNVPLNVNPHLGRKRDGAKFSLTVRNATDTNPADVWVDERANAATVLVQLISACAIMVSGETTKDGKPRRGKLYNTLMRSIGFDMTKPSEPTMQSDLETLVTKYLETWDYPQIPNCDPAPKKNVPSYAFKLRGNKGRGLIEAVCAFEELANEYGIPFEVESDVIVAMTIHRAMIEKRNADILAASNPAPVEVSNEERAAA